MAIRPLGDRPSRTEFESHPSRPEIDCQKCDLVAATLGGLRGQFEDFRENVERRFEEQKETVERTESSNVRRHEELKRSLDIFREHLTGGPTSIVQRLTLVEERNSSLTRMLGFLAATTVTTVITTVVSLVSGFLHFR